MPSGRVHTISTITLAGVLIYASFQSGWPSHQTSALAGGCLAGLLLSPDLDVDGGSISQAHARRVGGCVLGLIWSLIWRPYALLIPHRSPLSHLPVLGTALRLAYLVLIGWLVASALHLVGVRVGVPAWWPWALIGLALSDALHFVLDQTMRN